jgi:hypothetical protein
LKKVEEDGDDLSKQFNMRLTEEMRMMLDQLAVDATIKANKLTSPSEVVRRLIADEFGKRRKR